MAQERGPVSGRTHSRLRGCMFLQPRWRRKAPISSLNANVRRNSKRVHYGLCRWRTVLSDTDRKRKRKSRRAERSRRDGTCCVLMCIDPSCCRGPASSRAASWTHQFVPRKNIPGALMLLSVAVVEPRSINEFIDFVFIYTERRR